MACSRVEEFNEVLGIANDTQFDLTDMRSRDGTGSKLFISSDSRGREWKMNSETIKVLLIEDDEDDYILTRETPF